MTRILCVVVLFALVGDVQAADKSDPPPPPVQITKVEQSGAEIHPQGTVDKKEGGVIINAISDKGVVVKGTVGVLVDKKTGTWKFKNPITLPAAGKWKIEAVWQRKGEKDVTSPPVYVEVP